MRELIARMTRGEEAALSELYDRASAQIFGLCSKILRDAQRAEEATLDVFLQAWNQAAAYDPSRGSPEAWLLVMARSRALDILRSRRTTGLPQDAAEQVPDSSRAISGLAASMSLEHRDRVVAALDRVPTEERQVLDCAFFAGMSHSEIARHLDQPLGTVKSRIRSGLSRLRRSLAPIAAGGEAW